MATVSQKSTLTLPELTDRELENHLAALGLRSVDEYTQWCAANGFSIRVEKGWHERCKERYFALRPQLEARAARKKRELRRPQEAILRIAACELTAADLTQPYLVAIAEAFSVLEYHARNAFLQLVLHVQANANLLACPAIAEVGGESGNGFVRALAALAGQYSHWLRPVESWKAKTRNSRRQFSSLARHLLANYPVPLFMDSVWMLRESNERQQGWFIRLGLGASPRQLDLPVHLTRGMVRYFVTAPDHYTAASACRRAQVFALGGNERLVDAILGTELATDFTDDDFCCSVIRWLIANPTFDAAQLGPLVDYIRHLKLVRHPSFSIKGRTPAAILRQMHQWHADLRKEPVGADLSWQACGIGDFDCAEGTAATGDYHHWTIKEIITRRELYAEGRGLRHCVASYGSSCASGECAIWTLGKALENGRRKHVLTIQVALPGKVICQVRGKANRLPTEDEMEILRRWSAQERLTIDACVKTRV
jgi:hypothetical protein